jgi:hypothetical protein
MQAAEDGTRNDLAIRLHGSRIRRIFAERAMRPVVIVVVDIALQHAAQMTSAEDNHVVEVFAADRTDDPFGIAILPRRMRHGGAIPDAHRLNASAKDEAISAVIVAHEKTGRRVPGKCFRDLAREPFRSGMRRHLDVRDHTSAEAISRITREAFSVSGALIPRC